MSLFKQNQAINEINQEELDQKSHLESPTMTNTSELNLLENEEIMKNREDSAPILLAAQGQDHLITLSKAEEIGVIVAAIEGPITAKNREGTTRILNKDEPIYLYDTIATPADSYVKIVLNDGTIFQLGPNSRARMDKYSYEPEDELIDEFETYVSSGSFRYISGKISGDHSGQHTVIKTPSAHIGIRGSEIDAHVDDEGATTVLHLSGLVTITSQHHFKEVMVYERGTSVYIPNEKADHNIESLTEEHIDLRNEHWRVFDHVRAIDQNLPERAGEQNTYSLQSFSPKGETEEKTSQVDDDVGPHNPFSPGKTDVHDDQSVDDLISEHEQPGHEHREAIKDKFSYKPHQESEGMKKEMMEHDRMPSENERVTDDSNGVLPHDNDILPPDYGVPTDGGMTTGGDEGSDGDTIPTDDDTSETDDSETDDSETDDSGTDDEETGTDETPTDEESDETVLELTLHEDQAHTINLPPEAGEITQLIQPKQGTVLDHLDGRLTYTPTAHFHGEDSFSYILNDTTPVVVNLTLLPINDSPVAHDDRASIEEDTSLLLPAQLLLHNDEDVDEGETLSLVSVQENEDTQGSVFLNEQGDLVYLPPPNFSGQTVISYTLEDSQGIRDTAQLNIQVLAVNDAPTAVNDFIALEHHEVLQFSTALLLTNDRDVENDTLTVVHVFDPIGGTVSLIDDHITFIPNPDFIQGSFTYQVSDGHDISTAQVIINLNNVTPIAHNDGPFDIANQANLLIQGTELLKNDHHPNGETLQIIKITNSLNGEAQLDEQGDVLFTKGTTFKGEGGFEYQISDGRGEVDTAFVTVIGESFNQAPVAQDDGPFELGRRNEITIKGSDLLNNDSDPDGDALRVVEITTTQNVEVTLSEQGDLLLTRSPSFEREGELTYKITDGQGGFDTARITVIGETLNQAPIAEDDGPFDLANAETITIKAAELLSNDHDPDGDPLHLVEITTNLNGLATLDENGDVLFSRTPDFQGQGEFEYQISDNQGGFETARVTVIGNLPPIAQEDGPQNVLKNQFVVLSFESLLANDLDPNVGDTLRLTEVKNPINGEVQIVGTDNIIFTPTPDFTGEASFEYVITDNQGASAMAPYQMTVINTPPLARADNLTTLVDTPLSISADLLLANDFDADGDQLVVNQITSPDKGNVNPVGNDWVFTPESGFKGDIQFEYTLQDSSNAQATGIVTVTVIDQALIARDDPHPDQPALITAKNTPLLIPAVSLLSNDEGEALTITSVNNASNADVKLELNSDITFTPNPDFTGNATFDYTLTDANANTAQATVTVLIENSSPIAQADSAMTIQNVVLKIPVAQLLENDSDPDLNDTLTVITVDNPSNGTVELQEEEVVFTPALNFIGEAGFDYTITDNSSATASTNVAITVQVNQPPIIDLPSASTPLVYNTLSKQAQAIDPNATVIDEDSPDFDRGRLEVLITNNRSANDTLEIQNLGAISVSSHTGGVISFNSIPIGQFFINLISGALIANLNTAATPESMTALLQAITYKNTSPTPSTETRTIQMTLTDGDGGTSDVVSREIEIIITNVPPVAVDDSLLRHFNTYTTIPLADLLANDTDANPGDILNITELSNLSEGVEANIEGNEVQLFIDALVSENFEQASFDYHVKDSEGGEDTGTVFIRPGNVIPGTAGEDNLEGTENLDILLGKAGNDTFQPSVGHDILLGGEDDDLFLFDPTNATGIHINGNEGTDTLSLNGQNQILDLLQNRTLPEAQKFNLQGIEKIDMNTNGNNQIRLSVDDVLALSDSNRLIIEGDATSLVNSTSQGWQNQGIDSTGLYNRYTSGEAELLISVNIASQFIS
jgi:hypothetical protein